MFPLAASEEQFMQNAILGGSGIDENWGLRFVHDSRSDKCW